MILKFHYCILLFLCSVCVNAFWLNWSSFFNTGSCKHKYIDGGVSKSDADFILKKHNNLRRLIANGTLSGQPRGVNLKKLKWDKDLAEQAQIIANTCVYGHAPVDESRWSTGQNLYRKRSTKDVKNPDWNRAIQSWIDEHEKYTFSTEKRKGTGHYTQMIWATTEFVGCGYSYFETKEKMKYQKIYVCNYGPGGNIKGMLPYETGTKGCENLC
ncbi:hypothetical protein NQ315_008567 [Exocentrus adspersus]|uniref:SCP domain-containing protein n=1 Tax=Exocentrus adspersus TaxID=1586481 RepID=A0AAV8W655_9CUCU|nr:hypothetical protein NQ315_008567 [Exocentrus adspersus]